MSEKNGEHPFGDLGQLILFIIFLIVWLGDSFFIRKSTFLTPYVPLYLRLIVLALILGTALYLIKSGHVVIDHRQRPRGVITTGVFRYVRHPLYLASLLVYLGLTISTGSLFSLAVLVGIFVFYNIIASYEERLLETLFGDHYRQYKKSVGKWVPRIHHAR